MSMQLTQFIYCIEVCQVQWDTDQSIPKTVETHVIRTFFLLRHMFDFISPAAAELRRNHKMLTPPQILTFPICCVVLQQIEPTQLREC